MVTNQELDIFYKERRKKVFEKLSLGSLLLLPSNPISTRSRDTEFIYRQNSDILYLTGFEEQESILVLYKKLDGNLTTVLFVLPKDEEKETWNGKRIGPEMAVNQFNVDEAYPNGEFEQWISTAFEDSYTVYYPLAMDFSFDKKILSIYKSISKHKAKNYIGVRKFIDSIEILADLRLIKDEMEIKFLREATLISAKAHIKAMKSMKPNIFEYEIENIVNSYFRSKGASGPAYNSIAASGENATILHYTTNNKLCKDGDLFLIDAGAEYNYYASDITRTYPISGKFTDLQKIIYSIVLAAQYKGIEQCKPGNTFQSIHNEALKVIIKGLISLKILDDDPDKIIKEELYKPYYMHGTSHWLGLDTHDVGCKKIPKSKNLPPEDRMLEPGMVLTVEPGLYFSSNIKNLQKEFHGIGIRIEDDILITTNEPEILSKIVPKEIEEIEALMSR